ncbi:Rieske (2Fe-2S) protein [Pontibacter harenae]|uniref:Rieske (2Fe-2S) protein n=1 Tax=Pontibacter harenae TaxID=2894083 RepID=UPI001E45C580|nr:Rieske (2Fe-2S) protein [Pontibacter harenae]MCC9167648.1 Rieske (2Fe-2S) protein [Pontibacter harenae]
MSNSETSYTWHKIFSSEEEAKAQVPQRQLKQLVIDGHSICFAHTFAGFFAVQDACPHLGHSLSKGNYLNEVICPWHSYRYNLDNGKECDWRTRNAISYPLKIETEGLYVGIPVISKEA